MARGRMISKVISLDEKVNALSDDTARLLFTWLIPHLDCEGRMYGDALTVKSIVFPRRSISARKVEKYLKELENFSLISRYFVNGNEFLAMQKFEKHQTGLHKDRESPSQIPPIPQDLLRTNSGSCPSEVKDKVKDKEQEQDKGCCLSEKSEEDVIEAYEKNIGSVTEDMEAEIKLAVIRFTADWVFDAIREACLRNKPTWIYIAGILKNWQKYGKGAEVMRVGKGDRDGNYGKNVTR